MIKKTLSLGILFTFLIACNTSSNQDVKVDDEKEIASVNDSNEYMPGEKVNNPDKKDSMAVLIEKVKVKNELVDSDYELIGNFLNTNVDESKSEEFGYQLYEYFKGNQSHNLSLVNYLKNKDDNFKNDFLSKLIQLMCIDIGDDNYSYDKLIKDFIVFKDNAHVKKTFEECTGN